MSVCLQMSSNKEGTSETDSPACGGLAVSFLLDGFRCCLSCGVVTEMSEDVFIIPCSYNSVTIIQLHYAQLTEKKKILSTYH